LSIENHESVEKLGCVTLRKSNAAFSIVSAIGCTMLDHTLEISIVDPGDGVDEYAGALVHVSKYITLGCVGSLVDSTRDVLDDPMLDGRGAQVIEIVAAASERESPTIGRLLIENHESLSNDPT